MLAFIVGILLSVTISTIAVVAISKPLHALLSDLCDTERRSRFWQVFTQLMLYLTPMLAVIVVGLWGTTDGMVVLDAAFLRRILGSALAGVFVALLGIAYRISDAPSGARARSTQRQGEREFWGDKKPA